MILRIHGLCIFIETGKTEPIMQPKSVNVSSLYLNLCFENLGWFSLNGFEESEFR